VDHKQIKVNLFNQVIKTSKMSSTVVNGTDGFPLEARLAIVNVASRMDMFYNIQAVRMEATGQYFVNVNQGITGMCVFVYGLKFLCGWGRNDTYIM
jgi:hypothetical protein